MVETLSHEGGIGDRFIFAFATPDYGLFHTCHKGLIRKWILHLPEKIESIIDGWVSWYSVQIYFCVFFGLVPVHLSPFGVCSSESCSKRNTMNSWLSCCIIGSNFLFRTFLMSGLMIHLFVWLLLLKTISKKSWNLLLYSKLFLILVLFFYSAYSYIMKWSRRSSTGIRHCRQAFM